MDVGGSLTSGFQKSAVAFSLLSDTVCTRWLVRICIYSMRVENIERSRCSETY